MPFSAGGSPEQNFALVDLPKRHMCNLQVPPSTRLNFLEARFVP